MNTLFCKRGHPQTEANTRWITRKSDNRTFRQCLVCKRNAQKLRYRKDPTYHAREKERARERYYQRIGKTGAGNAGASEQPLGGGE